MRAIIIIGISVAVACGGGSTSKPAAPEQPGSRERVLVNVDAEGVGLGGHDPVAYESGTPAKGVPEHSSKWGGATYRFKSADTKATFDAALGARAPGYGGYCAFAASQNRLSPADPLVFQIMDGQLLVFTNEDFKAQFNKDAAGNKKKADANWAGLVAQHGKTL